MDEINITSLALVQGHGPQDEEYPGLPVHLEVIGKSLNDQVPAVAE